jgi:copper homeostasis protein
VLIRCRAGGFVYAAAEVAAMLASVDEMRQLGADGVAVGCLTGDGRIDIASTARLVEAARPMSVTFHRAIDRVAEEGAGELCRLGVDRVLTSGGAETAELGIDRLRRWVEAGFRVIAAGGVRAHNVGRIVAATGVAEVHAALHRLTAGHAPEALAAAVAELRRAADAVSQGSPAGRS